MDVRINESNLLNIDIDKLPAVISNSFDRIKNADNKVQESIKKARWAKDLAYEASHKSAKWSWDGSNKKEAIEALQKSAVSISDAQGSLTDAMKQFLESQKTIAEVTKYLFGLGAMNMAANRTVVRELELKLKDASEEQLSEMAQQELDNIIEQLKTQQDFQNRLNKQKAIIEGLESEINRFHSEMTMFKDEYAGKLEFIYKIKSKVDQKLIDINNEFVAEKNNIESYQKTASINLNKEFNEKYRQLESNISNLFDGLKKECNDILSQTNNLQVGVDLVRQKLLDEVSLLENKFQQEKVEFLIQNDKNRKVIKDECESAFQIHRENIKKLLENIREKSFINSDLYIMLITIISIIALIFNFI